MGSFHSLHAMEASQSSSLSINPRGSSSETHWRSRSYDPRRYILPSKCLLYSSDLHLCLPRKVIQHTPSLALEQIVAITQYYPQNKIGSPIAVGKMGVPSSSLERGDVKGKAVLVLHTWKDHLWEMGDRRNEDPPEPRDAITEATETNRARDIDDEDVVPTMGATGEPSNGTDGNQVAGDATSAEPNVQTTQLSSLTPEGKSMNFFEIIRTKYSKRCQRTFVVHFFKPFLLVCQQHPHLLFRYRPPVSGLPISFLPGRPMFKDPRG